MKLNKSQRSNLIFLVIFAVIFFTPLKGKLQEIVSRLVAASPSIEQTDYMIKVEDYNWELRKTDHSVYNFNQAKGKVVFLNFWATWCPPCRAELPSIQSLYSDYHDKVEFIFVSNEDSAVISSFLEKKGYSIPAYTQLTRTPTVFKVTSIPATYIINKNGEIVLHKIGPADWDAASFKEQLDALTAE